jgi:hypothetical protein
LKELAADTIEAYQRELVASGLPEQHFRLRLQLLGRLLPRRAKAAHSAAPRGLYLAFIAALKL